MEKMSLGVLSPPPPPRKSKIWYRSVDDISKCSFRNYLILGMDASDSTIPLHVGFQNLHILKSNNNK